MNPNLTRSERAEQTQPHHFLRYTEIICNSFFSFELFLRFLSSPNKLHFIRKTQNVIEFLAILPIFFPTESFGMAKSWPTKIHIYLEVFYILRILRIFVLAPKYSGLRVLLLTLKTSLGELFLYMMLLFMTLMIFATFEFYAEQIYEEDRNQFESILVSLWWAIVTMTTLGYGDIVPSTALGRIVGALCALCGLVFLALPIPVIVNNFTTFYAQAKGYQKLKAYLSDRKGLFNRAIALHFYNSPVYNFECLILLLFFFLLKNSIIENEFF
jgi:voltage-gated potassium channel Kch